LVVGVFVRRPQAVQELFHGLHDQVAGT
jgi:hypothetical protein